MREVRLSPEADLQCCQDGGFARTIPAVDEVHLPTEKAKRMTQQKKTMGRANAPQFRRKEAPWVWCKQTSQLRKKFNVKIMEPQLRKKLNTYKMEPRHGFVSTSEQGCRG